ncbi:MAG: glucose-1-phosphate cytidylyltransferase, partial [Candidatus Heimdallarchaeota archaeon]|nr:glucose-1-phosphate cytidylyltransferase [Candidatus Heimdallarchaeota archaeon]
HIMKTYAHYGFTEFVLCLGYKAYCVKEWFSNYCIHNDDMTLNLKTGEIEFHHKYRENWKVTLIDTGVNTMTGGRLKRIQHCIGDEPFLATYGDGVGDIDIGKLVDFHKKSGKLATLTSVIPEGRFGAMHIDEKDEVTSFSEKMDNQNWINAGFFVFEAKVFDYISGDDSVLEKDTLENLAKDGQLGAFKHTGFWKPMDKLIDKKELTKMWNKGKAPWQVWE